MENYDEMDNSSYLFPFKGQGRFHTCHMVNAVIIRTQYQNFANRFVYYGA